MVSFSLEDYPNADTDSAHLNEGCSAKVDNVTVSFKFGLEDCGTESAASDDGKYINYNNKINMQMKYDVPDDQTISRAHSVVFPFRCSFDKTALVTSGARDVDEDEEDPEVIGKISFNPRSTEVITEAGLFLWAEL